MTKGQVNNKLDSLVRMFAPQQVSTVDEGIEFYLFSAAAVQLLPLGLYSDIL